jgi:hypothetical protein
MPRHVLPLIGRYRSCPGDAGSYAVSRSLRAAARPSVTCRFTLV